MTDETQEQQDQAAVAALEAKVEQDAATLETDQHAAQAAEAKLETDTQAAQSQATTAAPDVGGMTAGGAEPDALDKAVAAGIAEHDGNPDSANVAKVAELRALATSMAGKPQAERDAAAAQLSEGA